MADTAGRLLCFLLLAFLAVASPSSVMRIRGGGVTDVLPTNKEKLLLTEADVKRLPWYFVLEMSPLRLGDTKYGMPYSGGKVNVRNTLWEKDPKAAMGLSLIEVAKDGADPSYAEKLLRIGADPNYPCPYKEKYSALHLAAIKGQTELARLLVKSGGDPHKRCKLGSAMDLARKYGNTETLSAMQEELKQRKK